MVGSCLRSLAEHVRRLEKKVERDKIVLTAMSELSTQIVEFACEQGRITMAEVIKLTGASRNTLKQRFRNSTERCTLDQHGSGRGVWYNLRRLRTQACRTCGRRDGLLPFS